MKLKFFILVLFVFLCKISFSQRDTSILIERDLLTSDNLVNLITDEIEIVSASRSSKKVEDLPISIYVVTREEIHMNGYITLADVLKSIPGFKVSQPGNGIDGETFLMRGLQGNFYTKIMINNIPVTPSVSGTFAIGSQLPIRQAERIEIIFGPASAVYGADATSGVINIITKDPENMNYAQADMVGGTNGYSYLNFSVGGKAGKYKNIFQYSLYGSRQDFENMNIIHENSNVYFPMHYFNTVSDYQKPFFFDFLGLQYADSISAEQLQILGLDENNAQYELYPPNYSGTFYQPEFTSISQKSELIGAKLNFKNLTLGYNYMYRQEHSSIGLTPFLYRYDDPSNFFANYSHIVSLQHSIPFGKFTSTTNISYHMYRLDNYSSYGINYLYNFDINDVYVYQASDDINAEQLFTFTPNEKLEFLTGFSYQYSGNLPTTNYMFNPFDEKLYKPFSKTVNYKDTIFGNFGINPKVLSNTGLFVQGYLTLKRWTIIGGCRYDDNSEYGTNLNPRWAFMFKLGKRWSFRSATGFSYKAPSHDKEYYSIAIPHGPNSDSIIYAFIPNESLTPEKFESTEFGIRYKLGENSAFDVSFYNNRIENIIHAVAVNPENVALPNMVSGNGNTIIRQYENVKNRETRLNGTQFSFIFNNLIKAISLNTEFYYNTNFGWERVVSQEFYDLQAIGEFPDIEEFVTDSIDVTMLPKNIVQLNISFIPFKNMYVNIENQWQSSWIKGYLPNSELADDIYFTTQGFYNLDFILNYKIGKNFYTYIKVLNVFDAEYGGIDATRTDIDLQYNPQYKRNFRFGINYRFE